MSKVIFDETSQTWFNEREIRNLPIAYGIVYWDDNYYEWGYFNQREDYKVVEINGDIVRVLIRNCKKPLYFNRAQGIYSTVNPGIDTTFAYGKFPYTFTRYYSTRYLEEAFQAKQKIKDEVSYKYINELPYTFGLEYETSAGYIPQEELYRVGLIPLRDGSITGIEYSTIVLGGNKGINALREQLKVLREYTIFDQDCSLHIHFGHFKLSPQVLFRLNNLFASSDIGYYSVPWAFETNRYKSNGKSYCKMNVPFSDFNSLYRTYVGREFFGDLFQPHPSDTSGDRKWNVVSRYKALNLINAICYDNAKTAEFRFLRPSYNFDKILVWIFVLGAFIKYAEDTKVRAIKNISVERIIKTVYSAELAQVLIRALHLQREVVQTQTLVKDYYGMRVDIEDQILTYQNMSKNCEFFY